MIYTVTLNPAMDKTVVVENLTPGGVNRIRSLRVDVGGKGINVSKCLKALGGESTAAAFWGGAAGQRGMAFLAENGIGSLPVILPQDTRTNLKIIDPIRQENTDINEPGPTVSPEQVAELLEKLDGQAVSGDIVILSGSVPRGCEPTIYRDMITRYRARGAKVFLDADGEPFRLGLTAAPSLVKPNREELERYVGRPLAAMEDVFGAAEQLLESGIEEVVVSLGAEGAVLLRQGLRLRAEGLRVPVGSTVGAGDAMVAALAYGMERGMAPAERLRLAVAISAASVMCSGTQAPEKKNIEELYSRVTVREA